MKNYEVTIEEVLTYRIEVEAENEKEAEDNAYNSEQFINSVCNENDSRVRNIREID